MPSDPALLQIMADRLAGLPTNGHKATDFPEPLATLWQNLDAQPAADASAVFMQWAGSDTIRMDLAGDIFKLTPGGNAAPDPWQVFSLKDAYQPRPPLEYLVGDTLIVPSLAMVYGAPGVMKSMLLADLCICVASGAPWLPPQDTNHKTERSTYQAGVLWCDFDNGKRRTAERFEALGKGRNLPDTTPLYYVSMPTPWLDAGNDTSVQDLAQRALRLKVRLIVIDNLGTIAGKADENSDEMTEVMKNMRWLVETTGATLILLHHRRKGYGGGGRAGEALRGHSSIEASLDLALLVEREEHSDNVTIKSTKTRDIDVYPFSAVFEYEHKPGGNELATASFLGVPVDDKLGKSAIQSAVIDVVRVNGPQNQTGIVKLVKGILPKAGVHAIRRETEELAALGILTFTCGGRTGTAKVYDLP